MGKPPRTKKSEVARATEAEPGPETAAMRTSFGVQRLGGRASSSAFSFGKARKGHIVGQPSMGGPGPGTYFQGTGAPALDGSGAAYSEVNRFGNASIATSSAKWADGVGRVSTDYR